MQAGLHSPVISLREEKKRNKSVEFRRPSLRALHILSRTSVYAAPCGTNKSVFLHLGGCRRERKPSVNKIPI